MSAEAFSNVMIEQEFLGALIATPQAGRAASSSILPQHFFEPAHARIFEAIQARGDIGELASLTTLASHLKQEWGAPFVANETFGSYVAKLVANAAPTVMLQGYAEDIKGMWALRAVQEAATRALGADGEIRTHLAEAFDAIDQVRAELVDAKATRESAGDSAHAMLLQVNSIRMGEAQPSGATTGYSDLDRVMLGYRPGELVVIAARPGMGKTTFGTSSLLRSAKAGNGVLLFSLELPREAIAARLLADMAFDPRFPLTHSDIRKGKDLSDEQFWRIQEADDAIRKLPFEIEYSPRLAVAEIAAKVSATKRRMAAKGAVLRCVAIDYLKFIKATDRYRGYRTYEVGEITAGLKGIAKDQEVCIMLLAQLNRGIEAEKDKRPDLHHLRESGDIEADADVVMFLFREAHYIEKSAEFKAGAPEARIAHEAVAHKLEMVIPKNRNGPTCSVNLFCDIGASAIRSAQNLYGDR